MTINNPEENDYVLVRNPNNKYIRELVWTPEVGEEGTPHIQAWVRLQRNQSLSFMKRLYPRGHFKNCDKDVYNENCHDYAQKNDDTTAGNHIITLNDPLPSIERLIMEVIERSVQNQLEQFNSIRSTPWTMAAYLKTPIRFKEIVSESAHVEKDLVREKGPAYAKVFVSPVYTRLWTRFGEEIFRHWVINASSLSQGGPDNASDGKEEEDSGSSHGGCASVEASDEGGSSGCSSEDDCEEQ